MTRCYRLFGDERKIGDSHCKRSVRSMDSDVQRFVPLRLTEKDRFGFHVIGSTHSQTSVRTFVVVVLHILLDHPDVLLNQFEGEHDLHRFAFECREKGFHGRVVVRISRSSERLGDGPFPDLFSEFQSSVLDTAVAGEQIGLVRPILDRLGEGQQSQPRVVFP